MPVLTYFRTVLLALQYCTNKSISYSLVPIIRRFPLETSSFLCSNMGFIKGQSVAVWILVVDVKPGLAVPW